MLRLGPAQVGVLRPDDGVVHCPAQVRRHIAPGKPGDRTIPPGGQLTPHFQLRDVLPGQKAGRRAAVRLQHRPQQVAGVCLLQPSPPASSTALSSSCPASREKPLYRPLPNASQMLICLAPIFRIALLHQETV